MAEFIIAFIVGLLVGTLGSGGAIVAIPAFMYLANYQPSKASSTSLLLVFFASVLATIGYGKKKQINVRNVLVFAPLGIIGALVGTKLHNRVSEMVLLGLFAFVLYVAGLTLIYKDKLIKRYAKNAESTPHTNVLLVGIVGLNFGFLTGLFGVGGGFLIVPLLVIVFRYEMKMAIGTSVAIIAINSISSLIFRFGNLESSVSEIIPLATLSLIGVLCGLYLHSRINEVKLQKGFSVILLFLATYTLIDFASSYIDI